MTVENIDELIHRQPFYNYILFFIRVTIVYQVVRFSNDELDTMNREG